MLLRVAYFFLEILLKTNMPYLIFFFLFIGKMNVLEFWLWSVYTGESKTYMGTSFPAIFRENTCLVIAVLKHDIVLAVVLRDWYNLCPFSRC